jgi:VWFA-related protein
MKTILCLGGLLALASAVPAQQDRPATVIKTETRVVQVDAVVTDKNGNPVSDLTAKDFHVWDDNKEQTIESFSLETHTGQGAAPAYTVLLFNNPMLDSPSETRVREAAARFVAANAGPGNLMAVAEYGNSLTVTQNFTPDAQRLQQVVSGARLAGSMADVIGVPGSTAASSTMGGNTMGTSNVSDIASREGQRRFLLAVASLAGSLGNVPGRKTLVLFSAGMPLDSTVTTTMTSSVNICNRSHVSVYPLETSGLVSSDTSSVLDKSAPQTASTRGRNPMATDPTPTSSITDQILHGLARGTGGYVSQNGNDMLGMMVKILKEESGYYLLGYTPPESPDGSCHALRVKVDRGADLRARGSYCNTKATDLLAGKPIERDLENRVTGDKAGNLAASMQLPFFYSEPGVARLDVAIDISSDTLKFEKVKGKLHGEANVLGIAYTSDGAAAARFSDTVHFDFASQKELDAFHAHPLHYEKQLYIAPGKYTFKVVFSAGAESFGKMEAPLQIDPYDGKEFMVSGLALSKEMHPASELGTAVDEELLEGRTPLVFHGLRVVPSGTNRFQKTDPVAIYLEIYDPLAATPQPPALQIMLSVLDKKTGEQKLTGAAKIDATGVAGNRSVPYGLRLKLDSLSPAWYTAEVKVLDAAGKTMTRTADFEVR